VLGTVCRAGDLIDLFDAASPEWGATAVSRQLDITKSQAHELLVSLEAIGLLRRAGRGRFRLGWKMVTLGDRVLRSEFDPAAAVHLRRLAKHAETSVDLVTFDGARCVRIAGCGPSNHSDGEARLTGQVSAAGKILLSGMTDERVAELLPGFNLVRELREVRDRQVAFEVGADRRGIAAPVHDAGGALLAAVCIAVPPKVWAIRRDGLTKAVVGTAARVSETLRRAADLPAFVMGEPGLAAA
jgi:IclR family KDG regulon transcriptional repressor